MYITQVVINLRVLISYRDENNKIQTHTCDDYLVDFLNWLSRNNYEIISISFRQKI